MAAGAAAARECGRRNPVSLEGALRERQESGRPVRVAVVGCGKFAAMFLAQLRHIPGIEVAALVDLEPERVRARLREIGWDPTAVPVTVDLEAAFAWGAEVMVEATGDPVVGARHALAAIERGLHVVMVNVEADALVGPALARRARDAGVVYSLAYGDQPALIVELVDWARTSGFRVVAAGKGTKYLPAYHASTPETVWRHYGIDAERARRAGMNPKMFNSFLDGTKSAIEMAAVANATGLRVPRDGLGFPPLGTDDLAQRLIPRSEGGLLEAAGMVEVVSCLHRDGRPVAGDLRWGVYVVFEAQNPYAAQCLDEYGLSTDASGRRSALWRPYHLIGLELAVSIARVAVAREATGFPKAWRAEVVACAKRELEEGTRLDGEGGFTVWGRLVPASRARREGLLPIGLAQGVRLKRRVPAFHVLTLDDVTRPPASEALALRAELAPARDEEP